MASYINSCKWQWQAFTFSIAKNPWKYSICSIRIENCMYNLAHQILKINSCLQSMAFIVPQYKGNFLWYKKWLSRVQSLRCVTCFSIFMLHYQPCEILQVRVKLITYIIPIKILWIYVFSGLRVQFTHHTHTIYVVIFERLIFCRCLPGRIFAF